MKFETENIEFKSCTTDALYKEVIAFANTEGGIIYVGIDDSGNVVGLENVDEAYTRITNGIRDAIAPDVTMFIKYTLQDNGVVKISVGEGSYKPYYLRSKGLKPGGVFVRQGTSCAPASYDLIRRMIKESDGDVFEGMRSLNQELSFEDAKKAFQKYNVEFSEEKYRVLGMVDKDCSLYTNLALLISDACAHTIKVAVFANEENTVFRDSKEFSGSVFKQLEDTFDYLLLCNQTKANFKGLERIEKKDYPEEAMREALLNAVVHRDYSFSGSIIINVNNKEMSFVSIGGLSDGLSKDDIMNGISQPRNKGLAEIFHRLRLIESYGTGIRKIFYLYKNCSVQPQIEVTPNTFKIILPNMNYCCDEKAERKSNISSQKRLVLEYAEKHGEITEAEIESLLGVKRTRAYDIAREMCSEGLVVRKGRGENKKYVLS